VGDPIKGKSQAGKQGFACIPNWVKVMFRGEKEKDQGNQPGHTSCEHHPELQFLQILIEPLE